MTEHTPVTNPVAPHEIHYGQRYVASNGCRVWVYSVTDDSIWFAYVKRNRDGSSRQGRRDPSWFAANMVLTHDFHDGILTEVDI